MEAQLKQTSTLVGCCISGPKEAYEHYSQALLLGVTLIGFFFAQKCETKYTVGF
jgi:hypothetical protein